MRVEGTPFVPSRLRKHLHQFENTYAAFRKRAVIQTANYVNVLQMHTTQPNTGSRCKYTTQPNRTDVLQRPKTNTLTAILISCFSEKVGLSDFI